MSDKIKSEEQAAVEEAPAPPHPRSDSAAQSPRELAGGSPCRDCIDDIVDASIRRGPTRYYEYCQHCNESWHGLPTEDCQGSYDNPVTVEHLQKRLNNTWDTVRKPGRD